MWPILLVILVIYALISGLIYYLLARSKKAKEKSKRELEEARRQQLVQVQLEEQSYQSALIKEYEDSRYEFENSRDAFNANGTIENLRRMQLWAQTDLIRYKDLRDKIPNYERAGYLDMMIQVFAYDPETLELRKPS